MGRLLRNNGLTLVMFGLFAVILVAQSLVGVREYNQEQQAHGQPAAGYLAYLGSGHFIEAVFENWESEFLQMGLYVLLTAYLFQKGSAESKDPESEEEAVDVDPRRFQGRPDAPWPVRQGGLALRVYENSLAAALFLLFALSLVLHAFGGAREYSAEQTAHGGQVVSTLEYFGTSRFWFESLENWQSEFLSIGVLVVLSIFLRQRGSPESKPVAAPYGQSGNQ